MMDTLPPLLLLALAGLGLVGGVITTVVGGSSLIVFPAMLALGFAPVPALASYAVASFPAGLAGVLADRASAPARDRRFLWQAGLSVAGGATGSLLLVNTPARLLDWLVPLLIGLATLLFAYANTLRALLARAGQKHPGDRIGLRLASALTYIYGGYFGTGIGIILMALFAATGITDLRQANVQKNLLLSFNAAAGMTVLILDRQVVWPAAMAMLVGAVLGGYAGGRLVMTMPTRYFRAIVVGVGAVMTVVYAARYWLG